MNLFLTSILPSRAYYRAWLLLALVFAFGLFDHALWSSNDTREGAMIKEMAREGVWVTPVFNGEHYLEKPPLLHWTAVVLCKVFGRVNEGMVRLPAALYGFGALWIIGLWARDLGRERAGVTAAFLCATSALYFEYTRIVLTDAALTFMVILSLYLFWKCYASIKPDWKCWPVGNGARSIALWVAFLAAAAVTFYAKGLIGPGFVWVSIMAFLAYRREWRLIVWLCIVFGVVFAVVLLPWVIALWNAGGGGKLLYGVFWTNQFGRFLAFNDPNLPLDPYYVHKESLLYYLFSLPVRLLPWTLLVIPAMVAWFRPKSAIAVCRSRTNPEATNSLAVMFLRFILVSMLALLHVSSAKAACYALPLFPILFLMTGVWLEDVAIRWNSSLDCRLVMLTFGLLGVAALAAPIGYMLVFLGGMNAIWVPGRGAAIVCLGLALITLVAGGYVAMQLWKAFRSDRTADSAGSVAPAGRREKAILSAPMILAVIGLMDAAIFMPAVNYQRTYEPLVELVRQEMNAGRRIALAGEHERDLGALMFYLDTRIKVISLSNVAEWQAFLYGRSSPAGIVVADGDLTHAKRLLTGKSYSIVCPSKGHKSSEFRLIIGGQDTAVTPSAEAPDRSRAVKPDLGIRLKGTKSPKRHKTE